MRSVEFHPEAQDELISAARFYESQTIGLGLDFILTFQRTYQRLLEFPATGRRLAAGSGVFWFRGFPTASCIVSSLSASTSWRSCTFTVDPATGGHGSEMTLPNSALQRPNGTGGRAW